MLLNDCYKFDKYHTSPSITGGYTWQYATHSNQGSTFKTPLTQAYISKLQQDMEGVEVIIFDEYSMQSLEHIYDMERRFAVSQSDPERRELPFGGRHVIYFGDCYQLPPPLSLAVYDVLHSTDKFYSWRKKGQDIWRSFDSFVELVENVRAFACTFVYFVHIDSP